MKIFDSLKEMHERNAPKRIIDEFTAFVRLQSSDEEDFKMFGSDFTTYFGGTLNIIETVSDLKGINLQHVDVAYYLSKGLDENPEWAFLASITNNAGGNCYFVSLKGIYKSRPTKVALESAIEESDSDTCYSYLDIKGGYTDVNSTPVPF